MPDNASWYAAGITAIGVVIAAWLSFRGSYHANRLNATALNLNAQLEGWKSYCDELTGRINAQDEQYVRLRAEVTAAEEHSRKCERELWAAERRIVVLEDRLGIKHQGTDEPKGN